jgi:small subunit ribosomal protein S24e
MAPGKKTKADFTVSTRRFLKNPLLKRRQFVVSVSHPAPWNGTVPAKAIQKKLASMYKVADESCVFVTNLRTKFGGGSTTGFGTIYDDIAAAKRGEEVFKLRRNGLGKKRGIARKSKKERKNRAKAFRGFEKSKKLAAGKGKKK